MEHNKQKGMAMIELIAGATIISIFLLVIIQFSALFTQTVYDVAQAETISAEKINEWNEINAQNGFMRPCLEEMDEHFVSTGGRGMSIGAGYWKRTFNISQEVKFVSEPICVHK